VRRGEQVARAPERIVLYDGVCGFCNSVVRWLARVDRAEAFRFAPLQGDTAAQLRREHPEIPDRLDTFVYVEAGRVHLRSRAFAHAARHLPWPWRLGKVVRFIPRPLADLVYSWLARVRYRLFGKYDTCPIPPANLRARFLP